MKRAYLYLITAFILLILLACLVEWRRKKSFIDIYTGSRMGFCEWMCGYRSNKWYVKSSIESFVQKENYPGDAKKWVSYKDEGVNLIGLRPMFFNRRHEHPGPILMVDIVTLNNYFDSLSIRDKKYVVDSLMSGDVSRIEKVMSDIANDRPVN